MSEPNATPDLSEAECQVLASIYLLTAKGRVSLYCRVLHARHGTYEEVARRVELDRRTVKKHIVGEA